MNWIHHVDRYTSMKQQGGYKFFGEEKTLRSYARHATSVGDEFTCSETIIEWAVQSSSDHHAREKLAQLRNFALWLHAEDERHEVPPPQVLGRNRRRRPTPELLTPAQIRQLMDAALSLGPAGSITPHTFHYLFGLMASTGLRRSEAVSLRLSDITTDGLLIRETKFRKSRLVPVDESVQDALEKYLSIRKQRAALDDHLFILSTGRRPSLSAVTKTFVNLARQIGVRSERGRTGPRLHGLRHAFATRSLEAVVEADRDSVNRHMLALSTYLGHTYPSSTYWYLEATPAVLRNIAEAAEEAFKGGTS